MLRVVLVSVAWCAVPASCTPFGAAETSISDGGSTSSSADASSPGGRFCDGVSNALRCWDFEGGESVGALFTQAVPSPSGLGIELESAGSDNRVLRAASTNEMFVRAELARPSSGEAYELAFRFRVERAGGGYCMLGAFFYAIAPAGGGRAFGAATYNTGSALGPENATGQTLLDVALGERWHSAVVRLEGTPRVSSVTIDGQAFVSTPVDEAPPGFEVRFGAFYCSDKSASSQVAFDDIVVRRL